MLIYFISQNIQLLIVVAVAFAFAITYILKTRGIYYSSPDTDNELMAYAAAQSHKWRWPSDVHKYSASTRKVSMKECTVILLSLFQKIFRSKTTDWPYVVMTGIAVSTSSILIYLIASSYFNEMTGLVVAILYIVSFWPWQVSLYGGHVNMANIFFLLSVYSIQMSLGTTLPPSVLIVAGGAFFGFCLFSSPSSHKYFTAVFSALFFISYRNFFASYDSATIMSSLPVNRLFLFDVVVIAVFLSAYAILLNFYRPIVKKMYLNKAPAFLNKIMSARDNFTLEYYTDHAKKVIETFGRRIFWILFTLLFVVNLIPASILLVFVGGFVLVFFTLALPNIKENVREYLAFILDKKTHFRFYETFFAKKGVTVQRKMRGAGPSWVPKMLWTFAPFHTLFFITLFMVGQYRSVVSGNISESILLTVVALVALSPIIWAEITKAPQMSRSYSPGLITSLLLPAYVIYDTVWTTSTLLIFSGFVILVFAWNLWKFSDDVYPARMTVRDFMRTVRRLGIHDVYTYRTILNNSFLDSIPGIGESVYLPKRDAVVPPFRLHYIQRLDEVTDGWIAIPGKTRLAIDATGESMSDDYTRDQIITNMVETKQMEKIAVAKLKTTLTSTIWVNEDEVNSFLALHLKDFGEDDLYKGHAWLVHSSKLKIVS